MATVVSFRKAAPAAATQPAAASPAATPVASVPAAAKVVQAVTVAPTPEPAPAPAAESAVAVQAESQLASPDLYNGLGGFEGEFEVSEMRTPYISLIQKTSPLFDEFPQLLGQFLYNKSVGLGDTVRVVFVRATKWWVEDLPYGTEQIPQRFKRMEEARAAGFQPNQLVEQADLDILIELDAGTEGIEEIADLVVGDKVYLPARYGVRSSAYGRTIPVLMGDMKGFLKGNFLNGFYTLAAQKVEGKKGTYFVPQLKTDGPTSAELKTAVVARFSPVTV